LGEIKNAKNLQRFGGKDSRRIVEHSGNSQADKKTPKKPHGVGNLGRVVSGFLEPSGNIQKALGTEGSGGSVGVGGKGKCEGSVCKLKKTGLFWREGSGRVKLFKSRAGKSS